MGGCLLLLALAVIVPAADGAAAKEKETPAVQPAPPSEPEITFTGKVFCSLKRRVDLPFKGVITSLPARSGQKVEAGEVLARYRLAPEAALQIRQRLSPPQISDLEVRLAEVERALVPVQAKQRELSQLTQKQLAPAQGLIQVNREIQLLTRERTAVQQRLSNDRQTAQQDQTVLRDQLGESLKSGQVPQEAALVAPITGYVIWVHPELREGAELPPTPGVFLVGVMDPMVVRGQAFEIEALQINTGNVAQVTLEALPGRKFEATVSRISWSSPTPGLDQPSYYDVELKVSNPDLSLKEGLKARIAFSKSR